MLVLTNLDTFKVPARVQAEARRLKGLSDSQLMLQGCKLVVANVIYRLPDHPDLLAPPFVHQAYDMPELLPRMLMFIDFWRKSLEGPLHRVELDIGGIGTTTRSAAYSGMVN